MSINRATLYGNLGADPEVRMTPADVKVATFSIATTEKGYTLPNGTVVPDRTEWHTVIAWRGLATIAERFLRKGNMVHVEGKICTRKWEKDGVNHYKTEIIATDIQLTPDCLKNQHAGTDAPAPDESTAPRANTHTGTQAKIDDLPEPIYPPNDKDDLPF